MPTVTKLEESRKRVQDAAEASLNSGKNGSNATKAVRDASQAGGEAVRKVMEATEDASRKTIDAAEQNLQQAADALRGTADHSAEAVAEMSKAASEVNGKALATVSQFSEMQDRALKDVAGRTQQNFGTMMQTGFKLADGYQTVMREWVNYASQAVQRNVDGMNSIMHAGSPQDLLKAQSDLVIAEVSLMLTSSAKIAEASAKVVREASENFGKK
jgi:hypothetical protein